MATTNKQQQKFAPIIIIVLAIGAVYLLGTRWDNIRSIFQSGRSVSTQTLDSTSGSNTSNYNKAVKMLQEIPEIQIIENAVIKNGRNTSFSSAGGENGDIVTVLLFEGGFPDKHTTRIDTFMVNIKTNEIQIYDATSVPNKNLSLDEWKKTVKERFP